MRRGLAAATGSDDFDGRRVGVVGLGKVGSALAAKLAEAGAHVIGCDLDAERAQRLADEHGIDGRAVGRGDPRRASSTCSRRAPPAA